jgi:hypothetical protein
MLSQAIERPVDSKTAFTEFVRPGMPAPIEQELQLQFQARQGCSIVYKWAIQTRSEEVVPA